MVTEGLSFLIPGVPKATQTGTIARLPNGRSFPLRRNTGWAEYCGLVAAYHAPPKLLKGPLTCLLTFYLPKPKSTKRDKPTVRPDVDNLAKGLLDKWNGILWRDDSEVTELLLRKRYREEPGLRVDVYPDRSL